MIKEFPCKRYPDDNYFQIEINDTSKLTYLTIYEEHFCSIQANIVLNEEHIDEIIDTLKKAKRKNKCKEKEEK